MHKLSIILFSMLPAIAHAIPSIDAADTADLLLAVGCGLMFGLGVLLGK